MKNIKNNPFALVWSKLSALSESKVNAKYEELDFYQSQEDESTIKSQQDLHPYLIDRVEPSVSHIIFSSYIRY